MCAVKRNAGWQAASAPPGVSLFFLHPPLRDSEAGRHSGYAVRRASVLRGLHNLRTCIAAAQKRAHPACIA